MRTVLLTGSAGHLGRALRAAFEAQGDYVVGIDSRAMPPDIRFDLDDPLHDFVGDILKRVGPYDVLVANAKCKTWEAHHALAEEARQCIVNIGSIYGLVGSDPSLYEGTEVEPSPAWYSASKGALISLTRWQAANLAPARSNCVCPGGIFRGHSDLFRQRYEARVPLGRMATEADIVGPVLWLCSEAAAYVTGQVIAVDGGATCMM